MKSLRRKMLQRIISENPKTSFKELAAKLCGRRMQCSTSNIPSEIPPILPRHSHAKLRVTNPAQGSRDYPCGEVPILTAVTKPKSMSKKAPAEVEWINPSELEVEPNFNVRTDKEIKENAKEIARDIEAHGGFDASEPITYIERDGKKLIRKGHTRHAAAVLLGLKQVAAMRVETDEVQDLVNLVTSNNGHPLRRDQQGEIFIRLRDGLTDGSMLKEGEAPKYLREPMKEKDIAALFHRTPQHIADCIVLKESPPEVAEMLEAGRVSANVIVAAQQLVNKHHKGGKGKLIEVLRAASAKARESGKETATKQHFDEIKATFIPAPKVKAEETTTGDDNNAPEPSKTKSKGKGKAADSGDAGDLFTAPADAPEQQSTKEPELQLTEDEQRLFAGEVPKKHSKTFENMKKLINRWAEIRETVVIDDEDIASLASAITLSPETPF